MCGNVRHLHPVSVLCAKALLRRQPKREFRHMKNSSTIIQQTMITTVMFPATLQKLLPPPQVTSTCRKDRHLGGVRRTSDIAARDRAASEIFSGSKISFGTELGRPLMCLMLNKLHNCAKRFPSRFFSSSQRGSSRSGALCFSLLLCCSRVFCCVRQSHHCRKNVLRGTTTWANAT